MMRITIDVPDQYAEAVRGELDRRGYNSSDREVGRVLRHVAGDVLDEHWWRTCGVVLWRRGNPQVADLYTRQEPQPWPATQISLDSPSEQEKTA